MNAFLISLLSFHYFQIFKRSQFKVSLEKLLAGSEVQGFWVQSFYEKTSIGGQISVSTEERQP